MDRPRMIPNEMITVILLWQDNNTVFAMKRRDNRHNAIRAAPAY